MTNTAIDPVESARLAATDASGWGRSFKLYQPRNLAYWVYALFVLIGFLGLLVQHVPVAEAYAPALVAGTIWFALYAVLLWRFTRGLDRYIPQPTSIVVAAFVWGGLAATWAMAGEGNDAVLALWAKAFGQSFVIDWGRALTAPFNEELSRAAGLILFIALAPRLVRSAFAGLVLGAFLGLGFEIVEDVTYVGQEAEARFGAEQVQAAISVSGVRSVTGLTSHLMYSALFCAGLVYLLGRPEEPARRVRGIVLILVAMVAHGVWNETALSGGNESVEGLMFVFLFVVPPVILFFLHRRDRDWLRDVMAPEVALGVIPQQELDALSGTLRNRWTYVKAGKGHPSHATQPVATSSPP
jgi:RsiW-degrading membrane proteinase PrsW (M82 family)